MGKIKREIIIFSCFNVLVLLFLSMFWLSISPIIRIIGISLLFIYLLYLVFNEIREIINRVISVVIAFIERIIQKFRVKWDKYRAHRTEIKEAKRFNKFKEDAMYARGQVTAGHVSTTQFKTPISNQLICPRCGSTNIYIDKKGYDTGKGCCGFLACGPLGFLFGLEGANELRKTCVICNNTWN